MMKMRTAGAAVLLCLFSALVVAAAESGGIQHEASDTDSASTQQTCQPDIHTVLREMSVLIAEQRVELRYTKTQLEALETRLRASERTVEEQRTVIKELKEKKEEQAAALRAMGDSVTLMGSQVEDLRREREKSRVSFSASLITTGDENYGPFKDATPLVFRNPLINIGNAYNPNTGVFTAPVRGVYHFVFFVFGNGHASTPTGLSLYKNNHHIVIAYSQQANMYVKPSNGASLLLEVGDVVYLKLWPNAWARDNDNHHTTFSGHLLFAV